MFSNSVYKVVCVGPNESGKSSIAELLHAGQYSNAVPTRIEPFRLSAENPVENQLFSQFEVIDTDNQPESAEHRAASIAEADLILLCYNVSEEDAETRVAAEWLDSEVLRECDAPIVVIPTHNDKLGAEQKEGLKDRLEKIISGNPKIELAFPFSNTSELELETITRLKAIILRSTLTPTSLIISSNGETVALSDKLLRCLKLVFKLTDEDHDGLLTPDDLNTFQRRVFQQELTKAELEAVIRTILEHRPNGVKLEGGSPRINFSGFRFLYDLFLSRNRLETIWTVVTAFGFNHRLEMDPEKLFGPVLPDELRIGHFELSPAATEFLRAAASLQRSMDETAFLALFKNEYANRRIHPFKNRFPKDECITNQASEIDADAWLALWHKLTHEEPQLATLGLAVLGFDVSNPEAPGLAPHKNLKDRNVFVGYVFGSKGAGKTSFVRSLVDKPFVEDTAELGPTPVVTRFFADKKYTLLLKEVDTEEASNVIAGDHPGFDVAIVLLERGNPESVAFASKLLEARAAGGAPVIFFETKADLAQSEHESPARAALLAHSLVPIAEVSAKTGISEKNFIVISAGAKHPHLIDPAARDAHQKALDSKQQQKQKKSEPSSLGLPFWDGLSDTQKTYFKAAAGSALVLGVFAAYRRFSGK